MSHYVPTDSTLYHARDMELGLYGYASFSLTVLPYTIMSFINLVGNLITPDYTVFQLVRSEVMDEARARGGKFDGTIGVVPVTENNEVQSMHGLDTISFEDIEGEKGMVFYKYVKKGHGGFRTHGAPTITVPSVGRYITRAKSASEKRMALVGNLLTVFVIFAPYVIIGTLTKFDPGNSTGSQRFWTISWLVVGQIGGLIVAMVMRNVGDSNGRMVLFISSAIFIVPSLGGMMTVATMMTGGGVCAAR